MLIRKAHYMSGVVAHKTDGKDRLRDLYTDTTNLSSSLLCPSLPSFLQMHKDLDEHTLTFTVVEKKAGKNKRGMSNLYYSSYIVGQFLQWGHTHM